MKKIYSSIFAVLMLTFMMFITANAMTECLVEDNIIDIADTVVYNRNGLGAVTVKNIKISNADVESATEDGTVFNIIMSGNTLPDETINVEFGTDLSKNMTVSGNKADVTLVDGEATVEMTVKGQYSSLSSLSGSVKFTLNFLVAQTSEEPPVIKTESDVKSTYNGVAIDIDLKKYFDGAKQFYIVDGEEKTPVDGRFYTFRSLIGGTFELIFSASNDYGECDDVVTVIIEVTEIESGLWLGIETSNGSVNYVKFSDENGNEIPGLTATIEDKNIDVCLPRSFDTDGKIVAAFDLTQNGSLPKLSTSNAFNGSNDTKVFATTLSGGVGKRTMYLYNAHPKATSNVYTTYTISYAIDNSMPYLSEAEKERTVQIAAGDTYTLELFPLFADDDGDELTYTVKINGEAPVEADADYSFTPTMGGIYELEFFASDFMSTSGECYKVIVTVTNSTVKYEFYVLVPKDTTPCFYITDGYDENGVDIVGETLEYEEIADAETDENYTCYAVYVPENIHTISVRDENYGGMAISSTDGGKAQLCRVFAKILDFGNREVQGTVSAVYDTCKAFGKDNGFLLLTEKEYSFTAMPQDTSTYNVATQKVVVLQDESEVNISVSYKNPKTVKTTTGAKALIFKYESNYHIHKVFEPLAVVDNGDGTSTHYFAVDGNISYRVSMDGKITKAGYMLSGNSVTVLHNEGDFLPTDRVDYSIAGTNASVVADDSILLNINQNNHLHLHIGETKTVKAYRAWEIINNHLNHIIQPDFHFEIITGDDVVTVVPYKNQPMTNASGNWYTLTAIGNGTAIVEITYDAIEITGGSYDGFYGATDKARTGLFVVMVGEESADVDFGIQCKTSVGNIVYKEENSKNWDSEFDTLYFIGDSGKISLCPTTSEGTVTEVAISCDKGESYTVLEENDGIYIAPVFSGNNILRVTTDNGIAYKIIRGDKAELFVKNVTNPGNPVAEGDTVSLTLVGLHTPIHKISGTYNPGYTANTDGESRVHLHYTFGETDVKSTGVQYDFSRNGTTLEFTVPKNSDREEFTFTDGYIGVGVIGVTGYSNDGDSHRNIPDGGGGTRENKTTFTTRSLLPDITVSIGMLPSGNTAPYIKEKAPKNVTLNLGGTYALSMSKIFTDRENDSLTYTAKIGDGETFDVQDGYFTFTPEQIGTYTMEFVAYDGEVNSNVHSITLTVKESSPPSSDKTPEYDLSEDEIAGYVKISFSDNGKRVKGEENVTYPKALGKIISSTKVPYKNGDTVADVTLRLLDAKGFTYEHTGTTKKGFYLASIGDFTLKGIDYDSFGEFDAGVGSGWMITLNDEFIEYGASDFEVENGDIIKWQYTCQLGKDIGDPFFDTIPESSVGGTQDNSSEKEDKEEKEESEKNEDYDKSEETEKSEEEESKEIEKDEEKSEKKIFTPETFHDVKISDWFYEAVSYVYEKGLMTGTDMGFEPQSKMTRAMLVTVLYRMSQDEEQEKEMSFVDVSADDWFHDAVLWAYKNEIVLGKDNSHFAPNDFVTREELVVILYRFAKIQSTESDNETALSEYADASQVSDWATDAVKWAAENGIINGTTMTTLSPKDTATRAQVATILVRFQNLTQEESETDK